MFAVTSTSQRHGLQTRVTLVWILWKKKKELIDPSSTAAVKHKTEN